MVLATPERIEPFKGGVPLDTRQEIFSKEDTPSLVKGDEPLCSKRRLAFHEHKGT